MLRNYVKVALRMFRRERGYVLLNVTGLAIGLACCALIVVFVRDELSYDRHHVNAERLVRVTRPTVSGSHWAPVGPPVGPALAGEMPEVESAVRVFPIGDERIMRVDGRLLEVSNGLFADPSVLEAFSYGLIFGNVETALNEPYETVLTASIAQRFFGQLDVVGETIEWPGFSDLTVTAVIEDIPPTTHLPFDYLVSMKTFTAPESEWINEARTWAGFYTYLLLNGPADVSSVEAKLPAFVDRFFDPDYEERAGTRMSLELQPITDIHLHSSLEKEYRPNGNVLYVVVFGVVAAFVLVIASVNFVNLTTARSGARLLEIGVRKTLGSSRSQLARQFLVESLVMSALACGFACALIGLGLPLLNAITGKNLGMTDLVTAENILGLTGLGLLTGVLSGLYPALYLSRLRPTRALRNDASGLRPALLRRGLVVFQFGLSIFMLASTVTVYKQLDYVRSAALGFDKEHVMSVPVHGEAAERIASSLDAFKEEVRSSTSITDVSYASDYPGERYSLENVRLDGQEDSHMMRIAWGADHDYAETLRLNIVRGRDFSRRAPADTSAWLINEAAARRLGVDDPTGNILRWGDRYAGPVVGVLENFHFASLHGPIEPLVIPLRPGVGGTLLVRVTDDVQGAIAHVKNRLDALVSGVPFSYQFLDDSFDALYRQEQRLSRVFTIFAGLAIVIACLGLFGLAAYTAAQRRKEIGIRKVLGATITQVVALLSKEFVRLVTVAFVIAAPVAYWAMGKWLEGFAYRTDLSLGVFLIAGSLALVIAVATVSFHSVQAATADPVKSLRYE